MNAQLGSSQTPTGQATSMTGAVYQEQNYQINQFEQQQQTHSQLTSDSSAGHLPPHYYEQVRFQQSVK